MLIYVDEVQREIDDILKYAGLIQEKFDAGRDAAELLLDAKALDMRMDNLYAMLPDGRMSGSGKRHSAFMVYWLERNDISNCAADIVGICEHDLPGTSKALASGRANWRGSVPTCAGISCRSSASANSTQRYARRL